MSEAEEIQFGTIEVRGEDTCWPPVKVDRLAAHDSGTLLFASVLAPTQIIKGIRGVLNTTKRCTISCSRVEVKKPTTPHAWGYMIHNLNRAEGGYGSEVERLPYGMAHAFFWARMPGFLRSLDEESIWQELKGDRFTTPLLRGWLPYIVGQLKDKQLLQEAASYRCHCGVLAATSDDLDQIVSDGIRNGSITIQGSTQKERAVA